MKVSSFILLIILLGSSCREKEEIPIDTSFYDQFHWGTCTALLNGKPWVGRPGFILPLNYYVGIEKDAISLSFVSYKGNFPVSRIYFNRINTQIGKYYIKAFGSDSTLNVIFPLPPIKNCSKLDNFIGGDVLTDRFKVYTPNNINNTLTVTSFDSITTEIKGTFSMTYYCPNPEYTKIDTLRFTNGVFHAKEKR